MVNRFKNEKVNYLWLVFLIVSLFPLLSQYKESYISINYLYFFIFPFCSFFLGQKKFIFVFFLLTSSLLLGILIHLKLDISQLINYLIFISFFLLIYARFPFSQKTFYLAILLISVLYSFFVIFQVFKYNFDFNINLKSDLREIVPLWPQRYLPVLVVAFFLTFRITKSNIIRLLLSSLFLFVIYLANTRSATYGLFFCLIFFIFILIKDSTKNLINKLILFFFIFLLFALVCIYNLDYLNIYTKSISNANHPFFSIIIDNTLNTITIFGYTFDIGSSEGRRIMGWIYASKWVINNNFLLGSGFVGISELSDNFYGSVHSEIFDWFLRTGIIGLLIFISYYFKALFIFFTNKNYCEFFILLSLLIYSLFNETIRISIVGFIVFVFISFALNNKRYQ